MIRLRRLAAIATLLAGLAMPAAAMAMDHVPYDGAAVSAAKESGQKIILGIWATWCGVCQAQIAVLDQLATDPRFDAITIFHIDFDTQKNVMRLVGAQVRSQMIAFDGTTEIDRLIDITDPVEIEAFLLALVDH
jgi:thioredoxin 1